MGTIKHISDGDVPQHILASTGDSTALPESKLADLVAGRLPGMEPGAEEAPRSELKRQILDLVAPTSTSVQTGGPKEAGVVYKRPGE